MSPEIIQTTRELVLPVGWLLGIIGVLAAVISTLAGLLWATMKERLAVQDGIISKLQDDIDRLSKGCGMDSCIWRNR